MGFFLILIPIALIAYAVIKLKPKKKKKRSAIKKIYKTTDGYFNNKPHQKKPRHVAVVDQRKSDGAVAVVKIYSKKNKLKKDNNAYIKNVTLKASKKHSELKEDSIVGKQVYIGVKQSDNTYKPIHTRDFEPTRDKLTTKELKAIKKNVQNDTSQHRKTHEQKMKKWHNNFGKKK